MYAPGFGIAEDPATGSAAAAGGAAAIRPLPIERATKARRERSLSAGSRRGRSSRSSLMGAVSVS